MRQDKAVVLLSGGIDSATCMAKACQEFGSVLPVHVQYGQQTADMEYEMAEAQRDHLNRAYPAVHVESMEVVDYSNVFGHFAEGVADEGKDFSHMTESDGRSSGYVPMRNLHLIATAAAFADVEGADSVFHGAQGGDQADYPDCRQGFMDSAAGAISKSLPSNQSLDLRIPLIHLTKPEVIRMGQSLGVDFELTYSCYTEVRSITTPEPCGECPACEERREAFREAGIVDPVEVPQ